jgi:hypothetical protein
MFPLQPTGEDLDRSALDRSEPRRLVPIPNRAKLSAKFDTFNIGVAPCVIMRRILPRIPRMDANSNKLKAG